MSTPTNATTPSPSAPSLDLGSSISLSASPSPTRAFAEIKSNPLAHAHLQHIVDDNESDTEDFELYGSVCGKRFKSHLADKKDQQFQQLVSKVGKLGNKLIRKHWDKTAKKQDVDIGIGRLALHVKDQPKIGHEDFKGKIEAIIKQNGHPNASHFQMDFSDMKLRFMENGNVVEIQKESLPQEVKEILEFLFSWEELHDKAKEILGIRVWHARYGFEGNRPIHGEAPFRLDNTQYDRHRPKDLEDYFKEGTFEYNHFQLLEQELPNDLKHSARAKIGDAARFINVFGNNLAAKIGEKETQLAQATDANRKKIEKEIDLLKKLKEKHDAIDLISVFTAAAFLEDNKPITDDLLTEKAGLATNARLNIFKKIRGLSSEKWRITPMSIWQGSAPDPDALKSIAIQTGDLYFHSDLQYLKRFNSSGAKRMVRPAQEEFVIHNLLNRETPNYVDDLRSFGFHEQDPAFQAELRQMITESRNQTFMSAS